MPEIARVIEQIPAYLAELILACLERAHVPRERELDTMIHGADEPEDWHVFTPAAAGYPDLCGECGAHISQHVQGDQPRAH